jgi:D-alanyl-D-alanine carboxypeptidase/D-alanyl-D-alanine-endopeptidase (penicillin-binding protein 4)
LVAGYVLAQALRDLGVRVDRIERGVVRDLPLVSYVTSKPLSEILPALGKYSDNFSAEMVFKSLSSAPNGVASFGASCTLTEAWLRARAPIPAGTRVVNGSGLFDANRISAATLVAVLEDAYEDPRRRDAMIAQLSTGGSDGTLASRFTAPELNGRVRAKTGTLDESLALSGYVLREGTQAPIVFSLLVNGVAGKHSEVRRQLDAIVSELARSSK